MKVDTWLFKELAGWDKRKLAALKKESTLHQAALKSAQSQGVKDIEELSNKINRLASFEFE